MVSELKHFIIFLIIYKTDFILLSKDGAHQLVLRSYNWPIWLIWNSTESIVMESAASGESHINHLNLVESWYLINFTPYQNSGFKNAYAGIPPQLFNLLTKDGLSSASLWEAVWTGLASFFKLCAEALTFSYFQG